MKGRKQIVERVSFCREIARKSQHRFFQHDRECSLQRCWLRNLVGGEIARPHDVLLMTSSCSPACITDDERRVTSVESELTDA